MPNSSYWKERFKQLEAAQNRKGADTYLEIENQYRQAQKEIEGKINTWYQRFATNNNLSMAEARRMLRDKELAELKWNVKDYIKQGQANAFNGQWIKELENASARFHISRLEALKLQTQQSLELMFGNQLDSIDTAMKRIYLDGYYHTAYELQKGFEIGWDIAGLDQKKIEKVIRKPWAVDGKNFSERIWGNKEKLISEVHREITQDIILGRDPQKAIDNISKKMNTSKVNAGRLIMTEEAYFSSAAQKDCFQDLGVEQYEIVATLDSHTSDICQNIDGQVFPMKDFEPGVTAPPFHVYCRSTTVPYFEEDFGQVEKRAARGEDGKTYYVSADMTYKEWKKSFVDGGDKSGLQEVKSDSIIKTQEKMKQVAEELKVENFPPSFTAKEELENTQAFVDYVNNLEGADANVVALFNHMGKLENIESNGIKFQISHAPNHAVTTSAYVMTGDMAEAKLTIPKLQGDNLAGQVNTTLHEEMHLMDMYGRQDPKKAGNWFSSSRRSLVDKLQQTSVDMSDDIKKLFAEHDAKWKDVSSAVYNKYNQQAIALNDSVRNRTFPGSLNDYKKQYKKLCSAMEYELNYECRNIMGGGIGNLQDIYDALSGGVFHDARKVKYGHGGSYYSSVESRVRETIANYAVLSVTRPDLIDLLRADKPELVAELDATIAGLLKKVRGE